MDFLSFIRPEFNSWDDYAWLGWVAAGAVIELIAMWNKTEGDTLSEHIWSFLSIVRDPSRWVGGSKHFWRAAWTLLFCYLLIHFVTGGWI